MRRAGGEISADVRWSLASLNCRGKRAGDMGDGVVVWALETNADVVASFSVLKRFLLRV